MKASKARLSLLCLLATLPLGACASSFDASAGELRLEVETGSAWFHDFPLFLGISKKNPPQIAIWIETPEGNYVSGLYVSEKAAKQAWLTSPGENVPSGGIRRPEALPVWSHRRGIAATDGLYMPTKEKPELDAISGPTPKRDFEIALQPSLRRFTIYVELNHSLDFNQSYPKGASPGEAGYSGGEWGSGQPSIVYAAAIDLDAGTESFEFQLLGHGSADGSEGSISPDLSTMTSALKIASRIRLRLAR